MFISDKTGLITLTLQQNMFTVEKKIKNINNQKSHTRRFK